MADDLKVYSLDDGANKYETLTKEQIITAITQTVETGSVGDVDTGFVRKLIELNSGLPFSLWIGTSAQFNELEQKEENVGYLLTDDTTLEDLETAINDTNNRIYNFNKALSSDIASLSQAVSNQINVHNTEISQVRSAINQISQSVSTLSVTYTYLGEAAPPPTLTLSPTANSVVTMGKLVFINYICPVSITLSNQPYAIKCSGAGLPTTGNAILCELLPQNLTDTSKEYRFLLNPTGNSEWSFVFTGDNDVTIPVGSYILRISDVIVKN